MRIDISRKMVDFREPSLELGPYMDNSPVRGRGVGRVETDIESYSELG